MINSTNIPNRLPPADSGIPPQEVSQETVQPPLPPLKVVLKHPPMERGEEIAPPLEIDVSVINESSLLAEQAETIDNLDAVVDTFSAKDSSKSTIHRIYNIIIDSIMSAFNKQVRGYCFIGATSNTEAKQLPSKIELKNQERDKIHHQIQNEMNKYNALNTRYEANADQIDRAKLKAQMDISYERIKSLVSDQLKVEREIEQLIVKLDEKNVLDAKGDRVRQQFSILGGKPVEIITDDQVKLDGMYLDAKAFRHTLKEAGCELATFRISFGEQNLQRQIQAISMPVEQLDTHGLTIIEALDKLRGFAGEPTNPDSNPGAGWTFVVDRERVLFVRSEELPAPGEEHPLFQYNYQDRQWIVKATSKVTVERTIQPLDDERPASGTVILSSGNAGIYEMHKSEALAFLYRNMNVVLFNFRGYGKSEGEPTERGLKLDMEAAYQLAKKKSGQEDRQILFKALCMSGGPAAHVASKHPETNIFLDQTYSDFKILVGEHSEKPVNEVLSAITKNASDESLRGKILAQLKSVLAIIATKLISFIAPDLNTAKSLAANRGHKAIFYTHDDIVTPFSHVENLVREISDAGQMDKLTLLSGPGEHASSLLKLKSSPAVYHAQEYQRLLKEKREVLAEAKREIAQIDAKIKKLNVEREEDRLIIEDLQRERGEINNNALEQIRILNSAIQDERQKLEFMIGPNAVKEEMTGRTQLDHFLRKAHLSDDIIQSDTQLRQSKESPAMRTLRDTAHNVNELINYMESVKGFFREEYRTIAQGKIVGISQIDGKFQLRVETADGEEVVQTLTRDEIQQLVIIANKVSKIEKMTGDLGKTQDQLNILDTVAKIGEKLVIEFTKTLDEEFKQYQRTMDKIKDGLPKLERILQRSSKKISRRLDRCVTEPNDDTRNSLTQCLAKANEQIDDLTEMIADLTEYQQVMFKTIDESLLFSPEEKTYQKGRIEADSISLISLLQEQIHPLNELRIRATVIKDKPIFYSEMSRIFEGYVHESKIILKESEKIKGNALRDLHIFLLRSEDKEYVEKINTSFQNLAEHISQLENLLTGSQSIDNYKKEFLAVYQNNPSLSHEDYLFIEIEATRTFDNYKNSIYQNLQELRETQRKLESTREESENFFNYLKNLGSLIENLTTDINEILQSKPDPDTEEEKSKVALLQSFFEDLEGWSQSGMKEVNKKFDILKKNEDIPQKIKEELVSQLSFFLSHINKSIETQKQLLDNELKKYDSKKTWIDIPLD